MIAKCMFSISVGNNFFKTYLRLFYELFKTEVPKITQKRNWTKCFPINSPLAIKSKT